MTRRVLVVTTNLSAAGGTSAGAAGNAWRLVIDELGEQVEGLVLAPKTADAPDRETIGGLEVRRIAPARPVESLEDAMRGPGAVRVAGVAAGLWWTVHRALSRDRYDLVHAFWAFPAGWACTRPRPSVPLLLSCPGSDLHTWAQRRATGSLLRDVLSRVDAVVANSTDGVEQAYAAGAPAAHLVRVCYDPDTFSLDPERPREPVVLYVGRMTRAKGIFVLADALRELAGRIPGLRFVACGTGPQAGAFEDAVRATLGERTTFLGPVPPTRVAREIAAARVTVLPSFGEGMPASAIESLAVGRPMVSTGVGEHATLIRRGGGSVVGPGDASALAEALTAVLATPYDPHRLNALVRGYTPSLVAEQILGIYDTLLEKDYTWPRGELFSSGAEVHADAMGTQTREILR